MYLEYLSLVTPLSLPNKAEHHRHIKPSAPQQDNCKYTPEYSVVLTSKTLKTINK